MGGIVGMLPFKFIPGRLKMEFIYFVVLWLNAFPAKSGVSATYLPRELLVHWKPDHKKHCRVLPGTYCEAHDKPVPSNTMTPCTHESKRAAQATVPTSVPEGTGGAEKGGKQNLDSLLVTYY